jgi:hypothetical protein
MFLNFTDVNVRMQTVFAFLTLLMLKLLYFDVVDVETDNHALRINRSVLHTACPTHTAGFMSPRTDSKASCTFTYTRSCLALPRSWACASKPSYRPQLGLT